MDERGYFRIVDRKKDMILVSGFNVYPNEIEDVLSQMPGVLECAAVGMPGREGGRGGESGDRQEEPRPHRGRGARLLRGQPDRLQAAQAVVEFRAELPKTPVGKILRRELRG